MSYEAYDEDVPLLRKLGLRTEDDAIVWTDDGCWNDLGTVELYPDPATRGSHVSPKIKVEVTSMPAQFWRFTITDRLEGGDVVVTTGSGSFRDYWQSVEHVAASTFYIAELV